MGRALVTGASSGIGEAFARRLARDGYDLEIVARRTDRLEALATELRADHGGAVDVRAADLTRADELAGVEEALRSDGELELLVNNAGFGSEGAFHELPIDAEAAMLRLNVEALVRLTHAALGGMVERRRGAVINVSSGLALVPSPFYATYGATKAFVNQFTEALSEELRGTGVRVQTLCPGLTRTEFQEAAGVDASSFPSFAWMEADAVVDASLADLKRGRLVCVPGLANRATQAITNVPLSRTVTRRVLGLFGRRQSGS